VSKLIICADLHLHNNRQFASRINWIDTGVNTLNQVIDYSRSNGNIPIVILGDIFHLKDRVPNTVLNAFYDCIVEASREIEFYILVGTHDAVLLSDSSLKQLGKFDNIYVISGTEANCHSYLGIYFSFIPYYRDEIEFIAQLNNLKDNIDWQLKNNKLLFLHQEIDSARYGTHIVKNRINKALFSEFDWVFSGHVHAAQNITDNIVYVGSLHQTNFGECANENSFIVYDSDNNNFIRIPTIAPKFVVATCPIEKEEYVGNLLKLYVDDGVNRNSLRKELYDNGCLGVVFESNSKETAEVKSMKMSSTDNYISVFTKFIDESNYTQKDTLKKLGTQILEEVSTK
jgi:DNA repair exonuclease SbcCD nuclease subunit